MISTGKAARKRYGTRVAAKRSKARTVHAKAKVYGSLPISVIAGTAPEFVRRHS